MAVKGTIFKKSLYLTKATESYKYAIVMLILFIFMLIFSKTESKAGYRSEHQKTVPLLCGVAESGF